MILILASRSRPVWPSKTTLWWKWARATTRLALSLNPWTSNKPTQESQECRRIVSSKCTTELFQKWSKGKLTQSEQLDWVPFSLRMVCRLLCSSKRIKRQENRKRVQVLLQLPRACVQLAKSLCPIWFPRKRMFWLGLRLSISLTSRRLGTTLISSWLSFKFKKRLRRKMKHWIQLFEFQTIKKILTLKNVSVRSKCK